MIIANLQYNPLLQIVINPNQWTQLNWIIP